MSKPILFYSKRSPECITLWKLLSSKNLLNNFIKICTDNNTKIPPVVTTIPAIFIKGRSLIHGAAIGMYLSNASAQSGQSTQSGKPDFQAKPTNNVNQESHPSVETSTNNLGGILDFNPVEMGNSFSDSYSFIQENPSPMDFCYQFIKNEKDNIITSASKSTNSGPSSQPNTQPTRSSGLDSRLEKLQKQRNNFN